MMSIRLRTSQVFNVSSILFLYAKNFIKCITKWTKLFLLQIFKILSWRRHISAVNIWNSPDFQRQESGSDLGSPYPLGGIYNMAAQLFTPLFVKSFHPRRLDQPLYLRQWWQLGFTCCRGERSKDDRKLRHHNMGASPNNRYIYLTLQISSNECFL